MANNNFVNVVNATGDTLVTTIDGKELTILTNGTQSLKFETGEKITANVSGNEVNFDLPGGENSWSTLVYTSVRLINVFPSAPNQGAISF